MKQAAIQVVAVADLLEYPLAAHVRLDGNGFVKWQHSRWLNSTSFRKMSWEVQGMARALFDFSQMETPVGTLPDDDEELAFMLRIEVRAFPAHAGMNRRTGLRPFDHPGVPRPRGDEPTALPASISAPRRSPPTRG